MNTVNTERVVEFMEILGTQSASTLRVNATSIQLPATAPQSLIIIDVRSLLSNSNTDVDLFITKFTDVADLLEWLVGIRHVQRRSAL